MNSDLSDSGPKPGNAKPGAQQRIETSTPQIDTPQIDTAQIDTAQIDTARARVNRAESNRAESTRVGELLGRTPRGEYSVVVRDDQGDPVVLRNAPLLDDGTPMPTRYWLISPTEIRRIGQLESNGGVHAAQAAIDPAAIAAAHHRYAAERDAELPSDHTGPRPSGGVGGTRTGVKCLHAHWAWYLAGGSDPIGAWVARLFGETPGTITLHAEHTVVQINPVTTVSIPWGPTNLTQHWLTGSDPPQPEDLTNALGTIADHLDDLQREYPGVAKFNNLCLRGAAATALLQLELGRVISPNDADTTKLSPSPTVTIDRATVEELFRITATETHRDRTENPGLPADHVTTIVATCAITVAWLRRFNVASIDIDPAIRP